MHEGGRDRRDPSGAMWTLLGAFGAIAASTCGFGPGGRADVTFALVASGAFAVLGMTVLGRPRWRAWATVRAGRLGHRGAGHGGDGPGDRRVVDFQVVQLNVRPAGPWLAATAAATLSGMAMALGLGRAIRRSSTPERPDPTDEADGPLEFDAPAARADRRVLWILRGVTVLGAATLVIGAGALVWLRQFVRRSVAGPPPPNLVPTVCVRGRDETAGAHPIGQPSGGHLEISTNEIAADQYRMCEEADVCNPSAPPEGGLRNDACADLARRLGAFADAEASYLRALELVGNDSERRFLTRRLREVREAAGSPAGRERETPS